jgi:hypothetical protein
MRGMMIRRRSAALALIVALAVAPAVTGCSIQNIVKTATGGNVDLGGKSVPSDFPSEVPLIKGEVVSGIGIGNTKDGKGWNVAIKVTGMDAYDTISQELSDAGFTGIDGSSLIPNDASSKGKTLIVEDANYGVVVVVADTGDGTFTANYTVTTKSQDSSN